MNGVKEEAAQGERQLIKARVYLHGIRMGDGFKRFPQYDYYIGRDIFLDNDHVYDRGGNYLGALES